MLGISACLGGVACRYDGGSNEITELKKLVEKNQAIMICPEVLGGLPTPRHPAEIQGGDGFAVWEGLAKVLDKEGNDYDGSFSGTRIKGMGVATAYFIRQGLPVYSEENWQEMRIT